MKSTIADAKELLRKPRSIAILSITAGLSAIAIAYFGYIQWRRFVIPTLVMIGALLWVRIGSTRLKRSTISGTVTVGGWGMLGIACALFIAAGIDTMLDTPQVVFLVLVAREVWIDFQTYRLDKRLGQATPDDIAAITQSTDVVKARLEDRKIKMIAAAGKFGTLIEKRGYRDRLAVH